MPESESAAPAPSPDEAQYRHIAATYGAALARLARAYEADAELCRDLLQDIHVALWRSVSHFDGRCSLRTWVYRIAHNVAASHVLKQRHGTLTGMLSLENLDIAMAEDHSVERLVDRRQALDKLLELIRGLHPLDRQIILLYLEDMDAASIGELTGMSPGNVSTKIHRIKRILTRRFHKGVQHVE